MVKKFQVIGPKLKYGGAGGAMIISARNGPEAKRKAFKTFKQYNRNVKKVSDLQSKPLTKKLQKQTSKYGSFQTKRKIQRK